MEFDQIIAATIHSPLPCWMGVPAISFWGWIPSGNERWRVGQFSIYGWNMMNRWKIETSIDYGGFPLPCLTITKGTMNKSIEVEIDSSDCPSRRGSVSSGGSPLQRWKRSCERSLDARVVTTVDEILHQLGWTRNHGINLAFVAASYIGFLSFFEAKGKFYWFQILVIDGHDVR